MNSRKGENNPNYKGGITPLRNKIRHSIAYKQWKDLVCLKCGLKCVDCGEVYDESSLEVHHSSRSFANLMQAFLNLHYKYSLPKDEEILLMLADCYSPFWDINNGVSLCKECHKKRHLGEKARGKL